MYRLNRAGYNTADRCIRQDVWRLRCLQLARLLLVRYRPGTVRHSSRQNYLERCSELLRFSGTQVGNSPRPAGSTKPAPRAAHARHTQQLPAATVPGGGPGRAPRPQRIYSTRPAPRDASRSGSIGATLSYFSSGGRRRRCHAREQALAEDRGTRGKVRQGGPHPATTAWLRSTGLPVPRGAKAT
jgi:hypothetical protein